MLNAWMITQYCHSYPKRDMLWLKYKLEDQTSAKLAYRELIRKLSEVLNVYVLRDVLGDNRGMIYIVGRKKLAETFRDTLKSITIEIELLSQTEYDLALNLSGDYWFNKPNPRTIRTEKRYQLIKQAISELETILNLKRDFYLDKFARMRKVRENELLDQTFFLEYIRENRLTHLKRYKWHK